MKTKIRQPDPAPRTIQSKTKAANQASVETILQRYADRTVQAAGLEEDELLQGKFEPVQREALDEEDELLQGKFEPVQREALDEEDELLQGKFEPVQRQAENRTGLPDSLKSGVENLSGFSMDDVRVHYNSAKPAQLQALAYTQGTDIHVAPGQEKHLPHEAWHVVQQKQGRVRPTMQLQGVNVNDNAGLEKEADVIGKIAVNFHSAEKFFKDTSIEADSNRSIQRAKVEVQTKNESGTIIISDITFLTNRMAFSRATKKLLCASSPSMAKTSTTLKPGFDRRHWEGNLVIKDQIKRMFIGQPLQNVLEHFEVTSIADLNYAIYRYWACRFSEFTNLRVGESDPNQALGRLAGVLKPHVDAGRDSFKPFEVSLESLGMEALNINTWEELMEWYYNANYDFTYTGEMIEELFESAQSFSFTYRYSI